MVGRAGVRRSLRSRGGPFLTGVLSDVYGSSFALSVIPLFCVAAAAVFALAAASTSPTSSWRGSAQRFRCAAHRGARAGSGYLRGSAGPRLAIKVASFTFRDITRAYRPRLQLRSIAPGRLACKAAMRMSRNVIR